jgi:hypothetical protein
MDYVCPLYVKITALSLVNKEFRICETTKNIQKNTRKPWVDTKFVVFPIFDSYGDSNSTGCVRRVLLPPNLF